MDIGKGEGGGEHCILYSLYSTATQNHLLKFALPPMQTSYASRWNILGAVGSPTQNSRVGHVDFMLFVLLSLALGSQREHNFQWNMGLCFTSYFVFSIAVLPHSPGLVYYYLLLRRETRIPPFSFRIGICDLFVHRGQKSYTRTAFGKLWTTPGVKCMKHASS